MKKIIVGALGSLAPLFLFAQNYSIDWFTIGPGGTSGGGSYTLGSIIGEPGASATLSGGTYTLAGGFWSAFASGTNRISIPITYNRENGSASIQLSWAGVPGDSALIQASVDLIHWETIGTNTVNDLALLLYTDLTAGQYSHRFYRAISAESYLPGTLFQVTNIADSGAGSLRQAILNANTNPGADSIVFNIPGSGPHTISPSSALPDITDTVVINGYTQPGARANTLAVSNNAVLKIELDGTFAPNFAHGLALAADNCTVRGLVVNRFGNTCACEPAAIAVGGRGNHIEGNFIGTDPSGTVGRANIGYGIYITSVSNFIGGTLPAMRNVISANSGYGIAIVASDNIVQGNYIGTTATGSAPLGNGYVAGILVSGGGRTVIGGTNAGAGNVISGNRFWGIHLLGGGTNIIQGNYIGTDPTGTVPLGNRQDGISIGGSSGNLIGGFDAAARNVISANGYDGGYAGVLVWNTADSPALGNAILGNTIFGNTGLGIDLLPPPGVTANDPGDADDGPNRLQNFPILTFAGSGTNTVVTGTLNSRANMTYRLEFFASAATDPTGFGGGETFIGATDVTTDGNGNANFTFLRVVPVPVGQFITATATSATGDTSEFSQARPLVEF